MFVCTCFSFFLWPSKKFFEDFQIPTFSKWSLRLQIIAERAVKQTKSLHRSFWVFMCKVKVHESIRSFKYNLHYQCFCVCMCSCVCVCHVSKSCYFMTKWRFVIGAFTIFTKHLYQQQPFVRGWTQAASSASFPFSKVYQDPTTH